MRLRHPPGRAGRIWIEHRLQVATRGVDLLDKKRRVLVQELRRLQVLARQTEQEWSLAAADLELWADRAAVMAGEGKLSMLAAKQPPADVSVRWRSSMGVAFASEAKVGTAVRPADSSGGSAASDAAIHAAERAVEAAVQDAAARSALALVGRELAVTARRQRSLERRWLPALTGALATLNAVLDEVEREEITRAVWIRGHTSGTAY